MKHTKVKIIADSLSPQGHRLTSFLLTYPRIIHAELLTHRLLSRNSSSSRAESIHKKLERVKNEMFIPERFAKNCKGMSNKEWIEGWQYDNMGDCRPAEYTAHDAVKDLWKNRGEYMLGAVEKMSGYGVHKQHANRLLEPFEYITVLVTTSEWDGFWSQRCPKYVVAGKMYYSRKDAIYDEGIVTCLNALGYHVLDNADKAYEATYNNENWYKLNTNTAQPEMMHLAELMWDTYNENVPKQLKEGEWHLPFGENIDDRKVRSHYLKEQKIDVANKYDGVWQNYLRDYYYPLAIKVCVARAARTSYLNHEGKDDYEADIKLYNFLKEQYHMSPFEHVARCQTEEEYELFSKTYPKTDKPLKQGQTLVWSAGLEGKEYIKEKGWCSNIRGFIQHRWEIENAS